MSRYYHKAPIIYANSEGKKYSDLGIDEIETEKTILQDKKDYLTFDLDYIDHHKQIINSTLDEILKELEKIDDFLIENSNVHTHIHYDHLRGGETERKHTEWQWNSKNKKELDILLYKYQSLFKIPFGYLRFLHLFYSGNILEINLVNGTYKPLSNFSYIGGKIFNIRGKITDVGETIYNDKFEPISNNILEKIKKLVEAQNFKNSKTITLKAHKISITKDIAIYYEMGDEYPKFSIDDSHDQKILKKWKIIKDKNHFSPDTNSRSPNYLNFNSSGTTEYEKPSFWKNWVEPAIGKGPFTEAELKEMGNERSWYLKKGWTPEAGYSYDSSRSLDHNVTYMALRELRIKYFSYAFDRKVNWLEGLHVGYDATNTSGPVPMEINIVNDKKDLKKIVDNFVEKNINNKLRKLELLLRSKIKEKEKSDNRGSVYIFYTQAYPKPVYKIGSTYKNPVERAEELSSTEMLYPYEVEYTMKIHDAEYYEKLIHKLLKDYRIRKDREFFKLDLDKIKKCLKQVYQISEKGKKKITLKKLQKEIKF